MSWACITSSDTVEMIVYVLPCEFMFIGRRKVGGHFIWLDVNFLRYFPTSKIRRSNFSIRFFACLGELSPKFRLTVARTLRNIERKFGDISKRTKRNSFSLLLHRTVVGFSRDNLLVIYSKIAASVNLSRRDSRLERNETRLVTYFWACREETWFHSLPRRAFLEGLKPFSLILGTIIHTVSWKEIIF